MFFFKVTNIMPTLTLENMTFQWFCKHLRGFIFAPPLILNGVASLTRWLGIGMTIDKVVNSDRLLFMKYIFPSYLERGPLHNGGERNRIL